MVSEYLSSLSFESTAQYAPVKTITVPSHCLELKALPKNSTDARTVKNFLVVVTTEHASGPNCETWNQHVHDTSRNQMFYSIFELTQRKINSCPKPPAIANVKRCQRISGWRETNGMNIFNSPLNTTAVPNKMLDLKFTKINEKIGWIVLNSDFVLPIVGIQHHMLGR